MHMRKLQLVATLVTALLLLPAMAKDRPQLADVAARQTHALYKSGGLIALQINSQDCHKYLEDKFFCIYLDTAAQQIDQSFASAAGFPLSPYFSGDQFLERVGPILFDAGMNMQDANDFLRLSYALVELALERNADG
ncbi:MAG: hypothetical protein NVV60_11800 [Luteimonas sp.]|nr:hypothetical protein [Luteimonas sp.]